MGTCFRGGSRHILLKSQRIHTDTEHGPLLRGRSRSRRPRVALLQLHKFRNNSILWMCHQKSDQFLSRKNKAHIATNTTNLRKPRLPLLCHRWITPTPHGTCLFPKWPHPQERNGLPRTRSHRLLLLSFPNKGVWEDRHPCTVDCTLYKSPNFLRHRRRALALSGVVLRDIIQVRLKVLVDLRGWIWMERRGREKGNKERLYLRRGDKQRGPELSLLWRLLSLKH